MQKLYWLLLDVWVEHVSLNSLTWVMYIWKSKRIRVYQHEVTSRYTIFVDLVPYEDIYWAKKVVDFTLKLIKIYGK